MNFSEHTHAPERRGGGVYASGHTSHLLTMVHSVETETDIVEGTLKKTLEEVSLKDPTVGWPVESELHEASSVDTSDWDCSTGISNADSVELEDN
jgi:hypothetical protein